MWNSVPLIALIGAILQFGNELKKIFEGIILLVEFHSAVTELINRIWDFPKFPWPLRHPLIFYLRAGCEPRLKHPLIYVIAKVWVNTRDCWRKAARRSASGVSLCSGLLGMRS
jgi:hypothetical protein